VMLAGIFVNIILGIFIFWMLTVKYGETYTPVANAHYGIVPGEVGIKMGLKAGDQIYAVNGIPIKRFEDITSSDVLLNQSVLDVLRGDQHLKFTVPKGILNEISDEGLDQFISHEPRTTFKVDSVFTGSNAQKAGLKNGDSVIAVNNNPIEFYDQIQSQLALNKNKAVTLTVKRGNDTLHMITNVTAEGTIGFAVTRDLPKEDTIKYGFLASLPIGASKALSTFTDNAKGLGKVFTGDVKFNKAVSGPVKIATMFGSHIDWVRFWGLVGLLSMVLAFTNLLPIPALDGGHSLFLLIEMIKGKPLSDKFLERAQIVGFVLLISLMVFVFGNDIFKQIVKH